MMRAETKKILEYALECLKEDLETGQNTSFTVCLHRALRAETLTADERRRQAHIARVEKVKEMDNRHLVERLQNLIWKKMSVWSVESEILLDAMERLKRYEDVPPKPEDEE